ncbi:uncharacterized protein LOC144449481 isoform X2 [Glandiceps talaboti]
MQTYHHKCFASLILLSIGVYFIFYQWNLDYHYRKVLARLGLDNILLGGTGMMNGTLQPSDHYVVPNIVHYVWLHCRPFSFMNMLSMASVYKIVKPDIILFHTDCEPEGELWDLVKLIPQLEIKYMEAPTEIFGHKLNPKWPQHQVDIARLRVLLEDGGVYFDLDVLVVNPLEPLRKYEYVAGRESPYLLNNGAILANSKSPFLTLFYESYRTYRSRCWACNSVSTHHNLAEKYPHLIHIENNGLTPPDVDIQTIYYGKYEWQKGHFAFHFFKDLDTRSKRLYAPRQPNGDWDRDFDAENIKALDSTFGEICRFIYYGNKDMIASGSVPPDPWWVTLAKV